jgi:hypothetical protein
MVAAIVVCVRSVAGYCSEFTTWASAAEALEAERVLCDPRCGPRGEAHAIICAGGVRRGSHDTRPLPLDEELAVLYPRPFYECPPEWAPTPAEYNRPFDKPRDGGVLNERIARVAQPRQPAAQTAVAYGPLCP